MFPQVQIGDNGYILSAQSSAAVDDEALPQSILNAGNPVQTYTYSDDEDVCTLAIYSDGSYAAYGFQSEISKGNGNGTWGYNTNNGRVFWNLYMNYYSMYYTIEYSSSGGKSSITSQGIPVGTWVGAPLNPYSGTLSLINYGITRGTQNTSGPATAYASELLTIENMPVCIMTLTVTVSNGGTPTVTASVDTPT